MALQVKPDIRVVFNNTGVEYPDTLEYKKLLTEKWNLNLIETQPIKSFWECLKRYGWPLYRGKGNKFGNPGKPQCCKYLKELPFKEFAETYGIKATITGLRAGESRVRMFSFGQFGQNYSTKKFYNIMKFNPIAFWNRRQVFSYLEEHAIPVNPIYSRGADRCGCMPCTGFVNWEKQLSHTNPRMYREVQRRRGVTLISDFTKFEDSIADNCGTIFEEGI
jgi:phosphoadenosine phosphosulfate reductase